MAFTNAGGIVTGNLVRDNVRLARATRARARVAVTLLAPSQMNRVPTTIKLLQEEYNPQWRLIAEEAARAGAEFDVDNIKQSSTFAVGALESFLEAADADIAKKFRDGDPIVLSLAERDGEPPAPASPGTVSERNGA